MTQTQRLVEVVAPEDARLKVAVAGADLRTHVISAWRMDDWRGAGQWIDVVGAFLAEHPLA